MRPIWPIFLACLILVGCRQEKECDCLGQFQGEIKCQRPRVALNRLQPKGRDSLLVSQVEKFISKRPAVLDSLVSVCQLAAREAGEGWHLMGVFQDRASVRHIVYFKRYLSDRMMAGCRVHLCFEGRPGLRDIFVYEVPLE